jgi:hypothetical protein
MKVPELPLSGKFLRFQKESIQKGHVQLGLEDVDIEDTELKAFQENIETLKRLFDLEIEQTLLDEKTAQLKEKAAERTLIKLEKATGWIAMEGKFKISNFNDRYICSYRHPVNDFISSNLSPITFSIFIPKDGLEEFVKDNYARSQGSLITLKVYGQVWRPIDRSNNTWDLEITPLAVYQ